MTWWLKFGMADKAISCVNCGRKNADISVGLCEDCIIAQSIASDIMEQYERDEQNKCADIDSVLRRLNHEIRHTVGSDTKTVIVHRDDLIEAIREIDILRAEIKEMNDFISSIQANHECR